MPGRVVGREVLGREVVGREVVGRESEATEGARCVEATEGAIERELELVK